MASVRGARRLPLDEFLVGVKRNALEPDELIVAVHVEPSGQPQTFMKVGPRNAMVIAVCSLAVVADRERGELRAAFGSAAPTSRLVTAPIDDADGFPDSVADAASPIDDVRGTAAYRRHALRVLTRACAREVPRMRIELTVNGELREADVWAGESLLTTLRDRLELPGSKNACEQGECGSCSVLLDGELVCSCLVLAAQADGHDVVTVEGLAREGELHPVQEAFADAGAVQCGFCTPGFVVAAADLLRRVPDPGDDEIREALSGNLCRCTGYAEDPRRRASGGGAMSTATRTVRRGRAESATRRADAVPKVTGEFAYSSDLHAAGMLWGHTVRSPHAHARIVAIDTSEALDDARRPRGAHARGRPGPEDVRPRVRRPARARDRPRRATSARRSRSSPPRSRSRRVELRPRCASSTSRSSRSSIPSARPRWSRSIPDRPDDGSRVPRRPAPERRALAW